MKVDMIVKNAKVFTSNEKQLCIEKTKGSIEAGKDADFNVFNEDLLTAAPEGFSFIKPAEVFMMGKKY